MTRVSADEIISKSITAKRTTIKQPRFLPPKNLQTTLITDTHIIIRPQGGRGGKGGGKRETLKKNLVRGLPLRPSNPDPVTVKPRKQ